MSEEFFDLEDLESRLYSQFYHGSEQESFPNSESNINISSLETPAMIYNVRCSNRYFHKVQPLNQQTYISVDFNADNIYTSRQNNSKSAEVTRQGNVGNHFHNNITVNQYTVPIIINPELNGVLNPTLKRRSVSSWPKDEKRLAKKSRRRQTRSEKKREKRRQSNRNNVIVEINLNNQKARVSDKLIETINISDDSDDEPVIIQNDLSIESKPVEVSQYINEDGSRGKFDSDNDIIFIPPPLIEVISLDDVEETNENSGVIECDRNHPPTSLYKMPKSVSSPVKHLDKSTKEFNELKISPELNACNDFLDNSSMDHNTINKFNFSLHGSDFNNTPGDTVRQASRVDFCETESSCSTNDLNRDVNSSLQTAVFDEIEFPKEDIFSEKNLESFGSYITPKRSASKRSETNSLTEFPEVSIRKALNDDTSSNSSSESDYDPTEFINKRTKIGNKTLPDLSPLQCNKKSSKKDVSKKKTASEFFKINSRSKKTGSFSESVDEEIDEHKAIRRRQLKIGRRAKNIFSEDTNANIQKTKLISKQGVSSGSEKFNKNKLESSNSENERSTETNIMHKVQRKKKIKSSTRRISEDNNGGQNVSRGLSRRDADEIEQSTIETNENYSEHRDNVETDAADIDLCTSQQKKVQNSPGPNITEIKTAYVTLVSDIVLETTKKQTLQEHVNMPSQQTCKKNKDKAKTKKGGIDLRKIKNSNMNIMNSSLPVSEKNIKSEVTSQALESEQALSFHEEGNLNRNKKEVIEDLTSAVKNKKVDYQENCQKPEFIDLGCQNISDLKIIDEVVSIEVSPQTNIEISSDSEDEHRNNDSVNLQTSIELANCTLNKVSLYNLQKQTGSGGSSGNNSTPGRRVDNKINEVFDIDAIRRSQSDDPEIWKIIPADRMLHMNIDRSDRRPRCNNCRQLGHVARRCTEKRLPPNCSLCGRSGHQEPRCPHKICMHCGNEGDYSTVYCWKCLLFRNSICHICNMRGHLAKTCPDLWRRYHLTTQEGPIVVFDKPQLKPRREQWCSGCAQQGHLEHECDYYNRAYPPSNPCIINYEDVLYPNSIPNSPSKDRLLENASVNPSPSCDHASPLTGISQNISSSQNVLQSPNDIPSNCTSSVTAAAISAPSTNITSVSKHDDFVNEIPETTGGTTETRLFNPCSISSDQDTGLSLKHPILHQMRLNYVESNRFYQNHKSRGMKAQNTNQLFNYGKRRIKHLMVSTPYRTVKQFLKKELSELEDLVVEGNPRYLKKMLFKYDRLSQFKKSFNDRILIERGFWNRILNMFIFGIHKFGDAKSHMNYLHTCLSDSELNIDKHHRQLLLNSYNYIFGVDRHIDVNYYKIMQQIIQFHDEGTFRANM